MPTGIPPDKMLRSARSFGRWAQSNRPTAALASADAATRPVAAAAERIPYPVEAFSVSMLHKAYAFDWRAFENDELHDLLLAALESGDPATIARYIEAHREQIKDPYEGQPIDRNWQATIGNRDVHEYGDFALTRFYDPTYSRGLSESWLALDAMLAEQDRPALLGFALGKPGYEFDPGRQGSYFQTPEQVVESLQRVEHIRHIGMLQSYAQLLRKCAADDLGVYVTF